MEIVLLLLGVVLGVLIGAGAMALRHRIVAPALPEQAAVTALERRISDDALVRDGLARLGDQLTALERDRAAGQAQLRQQVEDVRQSASELRRETTALGTALRKPQVRGRWGELQLRRAVELAGLVDRCDFSEQASFDGEDGVLRPDLLIRLTGNRCVVVDSKVPLDAFLDATSTDDADTALHHFERHARQVRQHVDALSAKQYWRAVPASPEFVVLYLPGESFLSAALDADRALLEYAAQRQVVLATPTTLIALLKTVALGWSHEQIADRAREIHELARDLHARLGVMGGHLDKLGRSLKSSVEAYNATVGSLENRVLVTARNFDDLGVGSRGRLDQPTPVKEEPRPLTAPELSSAHPNLSNLDDARSSRHGDRPSSSGLSPLG
ncbi:DNA recombination protein RmuC [Nocardioides sp. Bht2]|uniref:DNA recombination protein RmuC n=1 Tax=Nocardioides sp. Bht2 TaxID=3392297 RepID=UPI0039B3A580